MGDNHAKTEDDLTKIGKFGEAIDSSPADLAMLK